MTRSRLTPGDGDRRHGTISGYTNGKCRCGPCKAAMRKARAAWKARQVPPPPGDRRHGSDSTYTNYGCRCTPCRIAHAYARGSQGGPA